MPDAFGTHADVYFGDPDRPLPDWRAADDAAAMFVLASGSAAAAGSARRDPDDDEPTPAERAAVVGMLGFDPAEFDEAPRPEEHRMTYAARLRRILYCRDDASCVSCPRPARKLYRVAPGRPGGPLRILYAAGKSTPLVRNAAGQHVSARAKSGSSKCSQAASDWRTGKATPDTFKALAQCRAMAGSKHAAHLHRLAGNEAHAQHIEKVLGGIHVTKKSRDEQAKLLQARRSGRAGATMARGKAEPIPAEPEVHEGDFAMEPIPAGAKATAAKLPPREDMDVRNPGWEQATRKPSGVRAKPESGRPAAPEKPAGKIAAASAAHRAKVGAKRAAAPPAPAPAAPSPGRAAAMARQEAKPPAPTPAPRAKTDSDRAAQLDRIAGKAKGRADALHAAKGEALASKVKANALAGAGRGSPEAAAEAGKAHAGIAAKLDRLEDRRVQVGGMSGKLTGKLKASTKKIDRANTQAERAEGREPPEPPRSGPGPGPGPGPTPTPPAPKPAPAPAARPTLGDRLKALAAAHRKGRGLSPPERASEAKRLREDLPKEREYRAGQKALGRGKHSPSAQAEAAKPAAPAAPAPAGGFGLKQESAAGAKKTEFANAGGGRTGTMFDMKRGDLPGQTSLMDKVGSVDTHAGTAARPAPAPAPAPAARPAPFTPQEKRALARALPKMTGGSPAALTQTVRTDLARRGTLAGPDKEALLRTFAREHAADPDPRKPPGTP